MEKGLNLSDIGVSLVEIPKEVRLFIIDEQFKVKRETGNNRYSMEQTIYKLLLEYKAIKEGVK